MTSPVDRSSERPRLGTIWAHNAMALVGYRLAPALAAGVIAAGHLHGAGRGVLVGLAVLIASLLLDRSNHPLHLMPFAAFGVRLTVPVAGAAAALAAFAATGMPQPATAMVVPVFGAWASMLLGAFWTARLQRSCPIRIAVIGSRGLATGLAEELADAGIRSYSMVGWIAGEEPTAGAGEGGPRRLGSLVSVREIVQRHSIDLLVHGASRPEVDEESRYSRLQIFERVAGDCLDLPVRMIEASQLYEDLLGHVPLGQSNAAWFQYLLHPRFQPGVPGAKRAFDLVAGSLMLAAAAPALIAFAIAVKLTDGGPVLFRQSRIGERGEEFEMIKLRSMSIDAEGEGAKWSRDGDERVTAVGRLMRSAHIDELPQLWNVLCGEMTLVGPRPERRELISELEVHLPYYDRRHLVKPGLAGWAQARCGYGGSEEGTGWKLCHDLYYLKRRSLYFDLLVLVENLRIALRREVQFGVRAPREQFILGPAGSEPGEGHYTF